MEQQKFKRKVSLNIKNSNIRMHFTLIWSDRLEAFNRKFDDFLGNGGPSNRAGTSVL